MLGSSAEGMGDCKHGRGTRQYGLVEDIERVRSVLEGANSRGRALTPGNRNEGGGAQIPGHMRAEHEKRRTSVR